MIPSAVLFDCDGVVVDSEGIAFALLKQDLARAGLDLDEAAMQRLFLGGTVASLYLRARDLGADLPLDWVEEFYERLYIKLRQGPLRRFPRCGTGPDPRRRSRRLRQGAASR